jgi:DNA-binding PadR family transcriptional regulator
MIRTQSRDALQVDTGSLYPALHRLQRRGLVESEWRVSENQQRVREYRLTAKGREHLATERTKWERFCEAIGGIMSPPRESEP